LIDSDKAEFKRMLNAVMVIYYKPLLTNDGLRIWWGKLERYEFDIVTKAFDTYTNNVQSIPTPPTPADILNLCQHKVTIQKRLPSPLAMADAKQKLDEVSRYIAANMKPTKDYRAWARKILANPKNHIDIAIKDAKEATHE
jgi:hypothetical protein